MTFKGISYIIVFSDKHELKSHWIFLEFVCSRQTNFVIMKGHTNKLVKLGRMITMKKYPVEKIRSIAVMGQLASGKTTFMESVLHITGVKAKKGSVEEKNTASDYRTEEHDRLSSLSMSLIPAEYGDYKFNFLDTPGNRELISDVYQALSVVKGAILMIDATKGLDIGTEMILDELNERNVPTIIFINKMDKENIKLPELIQKLRDTIGYQAVPFIWPIGQAEDLKGYVDLVDMKSRVFDGTKTEEGAVPDDLKDTVEEMREQIVESVAETSEELLEKHFGGEELTQDEINQGLKEGVLAGDLKPIVIGSALKDIGVRTILEMLGRFMPSPSELKPMSGKTPDGKEVTRETKADAPLSGYVFKTTVDPFLGSVNLVKVFSGTLKAGQEVMIANTKKMVKVNNIFSLRGKQQIDIDEIGPGDIGAIVKVEGVYTGATLTDPKQSIVYEGPKFPTPTIYVAIHPKQKQDEDKISSVLQKLNLEDPSFQVQRNSETAQLLIGGQGMTHIGYILEKMKNMFKVEVNTSDQKIVYRETIKKKAEAEGRHKKQSGGSGQFGVVNMRFEPLDPNEEEFVFEEVIHGGSVPKNYFPAVEKGLVETLQKGPLAGFPVIGIKATLFDGSYHPVDSNEISFKMAATLAFKKACDQAKPTILEPIMKVEIIVKDDYVGDVMGDINKRRGSVLGMDPLGGNKQQITAEIPEAEIIKYNIDLKAMTQGSGAFTREFARYQEVPDNLIPKIVEEYTKEKDK